MFCDSENDIISDLVSRRRVAVIEAQANSHRRELLFS